MNEKTASNNAVGGLSTPSKMPCFSWSIPAASCKMGSLLRAVKGSTCFKCYALKGRYVFANVKQALQRRLNVFNADRQAWEQNMIKAIKLNEKSGFFRWFDSGDLQDLDMLLRIVRIAQALPFVRFWLPTKEYKLIRDYIAAGNEFPANLTVRISAPMVGGKAPKIGNLPTAEVVSKDWTCLASSQGGKCLDCRQCWDSSINVLYRIH